MLARIGSIQKKYSEGRSNPYLTRLENQLQSELFTVLYQEELAWFQRSKMSWLHDGDRNTKYYRLKIFNWRRRNKIIMLRDSNGQWMEEEDKIERVVTSFYQNIFLLKCRW